jgi:membrane protein required for colicin V production
MSLASLGAFDWVLLTLLAYSTIRAFLKGFLLEVFSLVGLVAGILLASWYCKAVAASLTHWITSFATAQIAAFLLIALGVMIMSGLVGRLLRSSASAIGLGFFDRLLGAGFGLVRGCLLGVALMMVLAAFGPRSDWIVNSQLVPYFLAGAHGVSFVVPHELEQQISKGATELKRKAPDWIKQP